MAGEVFVTIEITQDLIKASDIISYNITKEEVEHKNFTRINNFLKAMREAGEIARSKAFITFGYDDDSREIYAIPEVREYVATTFRRFPELFYYLHLGEHEIFLAILLCLFKIDSVTPHDSTNANQDVLMTLSKDVIIDVTDKLVKYADSIGDTDQEAINLIYDKINKFLHRGKAV